MRHLLWILPLIALVIFAPFSAQLDLETSSYFYHGDEFTNTRFTEFMYQRGEYPGLLLGGGSILLWMGTFFIPSWTRWRKASGAIALAFVVGPGLLVNAVFKDHWGRPRPREIEQFGGTETFRPFYQPNFVVHSDGNKSFPSGHVTMGFFFLILGLVAHREGYPFMTWIAYFLAGQLGLLLALTRIAQGGHFLSDTVCAGIFMWWVALACYYFVYRSTPAAELAYV